MGKHLGKIMKTILFFAFALLGITVLVAGFLKKG